MSVLAIPPALLLLAPPFGIYAIAAHPTCNLARLVIAALAFLALLSAALGLAFAVTLQQTLFRSATILNTCLRFTLGSCVIHLINVVLLRRFPRFYLCNMVLVTILLCATLSSLVASFLTYSAAPTVAAVFTLMSSILPFLLFVPLLSFGRLHHSSPQSPHKEKNFQSTRDELPTVYLRAPNEDHSPSTMMDQADDSSTTLYAFLICSMIVAILDAAFGIATRDSFLRSSTDIQISTAAIVIIQSICTVIWILCTMSAFLICPSTSTVSTPSSYFTPQPSRIVQSRSPQARPYYPCPTRSRRPLTIIPTLSQAPTPTPSQLTEDFFNLRDPFAPPSMGIGTSLGISFTPGTGGGSSPVAPLSPSRSKSKCRLKSKPSSASQATRISRSRRKTSASTRISAPPSTLAAVHVPAEDMDFDPEEAFLTQLLLRNLDAGAPAAGVQAQPPMRTRPRAPAVHRFTQDSTSTGRTLCDSEAFRLPRCSLSTEVGSACVSMCAGTGGSGEQLESPENVLE